MTTAQEKFDGFCSLLRQNDSSITRVYPPLEIQGYARPLGQALMQNSKVTHLHIGLDNMLDKSADSLESVIPLLQYLKTSPALKEVILSSLLSSTLLAQQLQHAILQAIATNARIEIVHLSAVRNLLPHSLAHLLTTTTSITTLKFFDDNFLSDITKLRLVAAALGANQTIQDLTLGLFVKQSRREGTTIEPISHDEPILLQQLAMHSSLKRLCLAMHGRNVTLIHAATLAMVLFSTQTLQCLELISYQFNRRTLSPILAALKANSTVTSLYLRFCNMDQEATDDFITFVQTQCNKGTNKLSNLFINTLPAKEMFTGANVGNVAATMLIGSSLQSLHLSDYVLYRIWGDYSIDMVSFFTTLSENEDQVSLTSLTLETVSTTGELSTSSGANALLDYIPKALRLRNLTVSRMDPNVDSELFLAALRSNGSLHTIAITKKPPATLALTCLEEPFFTLAQLGRIRNYNQRNQMIPLLLQEPMSSNNEQLDDSSNLSIFTHLFTATRPAVRTAPNSLVKGLLSTEKVIGTTAPNPPRSP